MPVASADGAASEDWPWARCMAARAFSVDGWQLLRRRRSGTVPLPGAGGNSPRPQSAPDAGDAESGSDEGVAFLRFFLLFSGRFFSFWVRGKRTQFTLALRSTGTGDGAQGSLIAHFHF